MGPETILIFGNNLSSQILLLSNTNFVEVEDEFRSERVKKCALFHSLQAKYGLALFSQFVFIIVVCTMLQ